MSFARHEGQIHDRVVVTDDKGEYEGDLTVIAGDDEGDVVALMTHFGRANFSVHLSASDARVLGALLIAAADDTMSRPVTPKDAGTDESEPS